MRVIWKCIKITIFWDPWFSLNSDNIGSAGGNSKLPVIVKNSVHLKWNSLYEVCTLPHTFPKPELDSLCQTVFVTFWNQQQAGLPQAVIGQVCANQSNSFFILHRTTSVTIHVNNEVQECLRGQTDLFVPLFPFLLLITSPSSLWQQALHSAFKSGHSEKL